MCLYNVHRISAIRIYAPRYWLAASGINVRVEGMVAAGADKRRRALWGLRSIGRYASALTFAGFAMTYEGREVKRLRDRNLRVVNFSVSHGSLLTLIGGWTVSSMHYLPLFFHVASLPSNHDVPKV